ncbi:MAG: hypothetical protein GY773_33025 [Actinomycetia bacterium]|nr:hypothetical protein [Actinomycetes bacterium]
MAEVVGAHLVGSAPVEEPEQLFRLVGAHLGRHVRRIPDGEVGERDTWIRWQYPRLGQCPQLEAAVIDTGYLGRELAQYAIKGGAGPIELVDLGYADAALESWERFRRAKEEQTIGAEVRFLVGLPSPLSVVTMYVAPQARPAVLEAWLAAMEQQLERIVDGIPNDELAVQWEVCIEFGILEGLWTLLDTGLSGDEARPGIGPHLVHLGDLVPEPVELGYHLCYGDSGHQHFTEPSDTGNLAWAASTALTGVRRPVQWIHLPVPRDRNDAAYFEPLRDVALPVETELYLGLVHETGGEEATRRRIEAASSVLPRFGVATECGMGRRPLSSMGPLLDQHANVSDPIRSEGVN